MYETPSINFDKKLQFCYNTFNCTENAEIKTFCHKKTWETAAASHRLKKMAPAVLKGEPYETQL